jgi:hypothetical protein
MATKFTTLTHRMVTQLDLVAESCTNCSSRSRWPVRKLLDKLLYLNSGENAFRRPGFFIKINSPERIKLLIHYDNLMNKISH